MSATETNIKDEAGPKFWYVLEQVVNKIPDNPKKSDIRRAQKTMDHIAESFPCDECVESYHKYKEEHPLECSNKTECAEYLCEFHNDIRRKQGKETKECKTKDKEEEDCPNCKGTKHEEGDKEETEEKSQPSNVPDVDIEASSTKELGLGESGLSSSNLQPVDEHTDVKFGTITPKVVSSPKNVHSRVRVVKEPGILVNGTSDSTIHKTSSLNELKNITRRIVEDICRKHGAPVPEIIFSPCPSNTKTSCTRVPVNMQGQMVKELPTKLYFDPHSASPRSIVHEATHYIAKWSGDDKLFKDEVAIDTIARQVIDAGYTEHEAIPGPHPPIPMPSQMTQIAHDMFSDGPNWLASGFKERADKRLAEWKRNFPTFSRLFSGDNKSGPAADVQVEQPVVVNTNPEPPVKAEPIETHQHTAYTDGFMAMVDPVFAPIANIVGLQPRDVADAHVPNIIGNVITTVADSNLNDFGALLVSAGTAGITLLLGVLAKDQLGMGDRRFMMGMGGNLLWNSLAYIANPKRSKSVFTHANMFGKAISNLDAQQMNYCVSYQGAIDGQGKPIPKLTPAEVRGLQKEGGFQPDVPMQASYPIQGQSTGGIGQAYGGHAVPASYAYAQAPTGGARPYGNLDADFDEYSLEENNRIARAQRAAFSPAIA